MSRFLKKTEKVFKELEGIDFWFAGGCLRDFLNKEEPKDYDLYFKSSEDSHEALDRFRHDFTIEGDFVSTTQFEGLKLSFIHNRNFQDSEEIINGFDFHCVCACIDQDKNYSKHPWFEEMAKAKRLTVNNITTPFSTMERVVRLVKRGYEIDTGELYKIAMAINTVEALGMEYYNITKGAK